MNTQIIATAKVISAKVAALLATINSGSLLSDAKAHLKTLDAEAAQMLNGVSVEIPLGVEPSAEWLLYSASRCGELAKQRSRSGLITELEALVATFALHLPEEDEEPTGAISRLEELEVSIKADLQAAANSMLRIGIALLEAREEFDNQASFLEWVLAKFELKKTYTFKLMKLAKEFGDDERFLSASARVLQMLAGESDAVKEQAAALAADGKLNPSTARTLTGQDQKPEEQPEQPQQQPEDDKSPLDDEPQQQPQTQPAPQQELLDTISSLTVRLDKLLAENAALAEQLAAAQRPAKAKALPMLPHFRSPDFAVRLGLTQATADSKAVRAAYREITKHYTPETNAEAFELLTQAFDFITKG